METPTCKFIIDYLATSVGGEQHFVPAYAPHRPACQNIIAGRYYEPDTHRLVKDIFEVLPGNLIHAGTFFGDMLPSFANSVGGGRVFAFEPVLENYVLAKLTTAANDLENVILFNAALGDAVGTARISTLGDDGLHKGGSSSIAGDGQICTMLTLDGLGLPDISVIQLDVEGFEVHALNGASTILSTQMPVVMVEDNGRGCEAFLQDRGYELVGAIPGLNIYLPRNQNARARQIVDRLALSV